MHKNEVLCLVKLHTISEINADRLDELISAKRWSNSDLCRELGKHVRWISDVKRGKNMPTFEVGAKICVLLNAMPNELFPNQDDANEISSLIEAQKIIPAGVGEEMSLVRKTAIELVNSLTDEQLKKLIPILEAAKGIK